MDCPVRLLHSLTDEIAPPEFALSLAKKLRSQKVGNPPKGAVLTYCGLLDMLRRIVSKRFVPNH